MQWLQYQAWWCNFYRTLYTWNTKCASFHKIYILWCVKAGKKHNLAQITSDLRTRKRLPKCGLPRSLRSRHEISGPLEYHIQIIPSSLYMGPLIFKPVFVILHTENADKNWLENEKNDIQGRRKYLNMLLQRSRDFMSAPKTLETLNKRATTPDWLSRHWVISAGQKWAKPVLLLLRLFIPHFPCYFSRILITAIVGYCDAVGVTVWHNWPLVFLSEQFNRPKYRPKGILKMDIMYELLQ